MKLLQFEEQNLPRHTALLNFNSIKNSSAQFQGDLVHGYYILSKGINSVSKQNKPSISS